MIAVVLEVIREHLSAAGFDSDINKRWKDDIPILRGPAGSWELEIIGETAVLELENCYDGHSLDSHLERVSLADPDSLDRLVQLLETHFSLGD